MTILSVAVEAVTVAGPFRDYYKFARLEKPARSVKKNGGPLRGFTPAAGSSRETRRTLPQSRILAVGKPTPLKKRIFPYKNFLLDTE